MTVSANDAVGDADQPTVVLPPLPREEVIVPTASTAQRELYEALMTGLPNEDQGDLENLMIDNIERLRSDGDSYAP